MLCCHKSILPEFPRCPSLFITRRFPLQVWHVKRYARIKDVITTTTVYEVTVCHRMSSVLVASQRSASELRIYFLNVLIVDEVLFGFGAYPGDHGDLQPALQNSPGLHAKQSYRRTKFW